MNSSDQQDNARPKDGGEGKKVERNLFGEIPPGKRDELRRRLDHIEDSVNRMKVPASFAGQFYGLREHIGFVRERLRDT